MSGEWSAYFFWSYLELHSMASQWPKSKKYFIIFIFRLHEIIDFTGHLAKIVTQKYFAHNSLNGYVNGEHLVNIKETEFGFCANELKKRMCLHAQRTPHTSNTNDLKNLNIISFVCISSVRAMEIRF